MINNAEVENDKIKQLYCSFCNELYVPIYAKPWYMDAVCEPQNWSVKLFYSGEEVIAAMPYYIEQRGSYKYITRPLLTQNNGIIFKYPQGAGKIAKSKFEEKVIEEACEYLSTLNLDVFEEQFHYSFNNWLPFFWNRYTAITRYTYVIDDTNDLDKVWGNISSKQRSIIKKGQRNSLLGIDGELSIEEYYKNYVKIFHKQNMQCPYSFELWKRVATECTERGQGKMLYRTSVDGDIACVSFVIWDEKYLYKIMGGPIPEYSYLDAYAAMTWDEINLAHKLGLGYDFEGSVVKRISKSFREYGGDARPYFRIRKVFNPEIVRKEAEDYIEINQKELKKEN